MCSHIGLRMTAFTISLTQLCACAVEYGGWSESSNRGVIHVTAGSRLASMSGTMRSTGRMCSCQRSVWNTFPMPL